MYTIHAVKDSHVIPCVYALLAGKNTDTLAVVLHSELSVTVVALTLMVHPLLCYTRGSSIRDSSARYSVILDFESYSQ